MAAIVGTATAEALMLIWPVHPIDSTLAAQSVATVTAPPSFVSVLVNLIPLNPVAAAAQAAMAPLIVFAAIFGVAISRLPGGARGLLVDFFKAAADAMLIIVNWVLSAAPIGIFVLTLEVAANIGVWVALGLVQYVLLLSMVLAVRIGLRNNGGTIEWNAASALFAGCARAAGPCREYAILNGLPSGVGAGSRIP